MHDVPPGLPLELRIEKTWYYRHLNIKTPHGEFFWDAESVEGVGGILPSSAWSKVSKCKGIKE